MSTDKTRAPFLTMRSCLLSILIAAFCLTLLAIGVREALGWLFPRETFNVITIMPFPADFEVVATDEVLEGTQRDVVVTTYLALSEDQGTLDDLVEHFESRNYETSSRHLPESLWRGSPADGGRGLVEIYAAESFIDFVAYIDFYEMEDFAQELNRMLRDNSEPDPTFVLSLRP